ncbi:MAG: hypothetical protein OXF98_03440 [Rhodospirillaceae bacterium]|nr:hypothetical protein [Rhodospirillaceae bacterium]
MGTSLHASPYREDSARTLRARRRWVATPTHIADTQINARFAQAKGAFFAAMTAA